MKRLPLLALLAVPALVFAQAKPLQCPVTRLSIPSAKAAVGKSTYKKKTYFFCTGNCKKNFDKNPAKYAK